MPDRPCVFCGAEVTSTVAEVDYCDGCYYRGWHLNARFHRLMVDLPLQAYWEHTGGGVFVLEISLDTGGHLWATADQDSGPPDDEHGPWWLLRYTGDVDDEGEVVACGLDRRGLIFEVGRVAKYG